MAVTEAGPRHQMENALHHRPRLYQEEVFGMAIKGNVIVYLDTGAGKTLIAVLVIKHVLDQIEIETESQEKKFVFFLAPKVALVKQQAEYLSRSLDTQVRHLVGEMGIDAWNDQRWKDELKAYQVFVCTPQVMLNAMRSGFLKMKQVALMVFDECHHCKKKEPYNLIMLEFYFDSKKSERPRVLGMTASPLDSKVSKEGGQVERFFRELEERLDAQIVSVDQDSVKQAVSLPNADYLEYPSLETSLGQEVTTAIFALEGIKGQLDDETHRHRLSYFSDTSQRFGPDNAILDAKLPKSETSRLSRIVGRIIHVLEEVGALGALISLGEALKPKKEVLIDALKQDMKQEALANIRDDAVTADNVSEPSMWFHMGDRMGNLIQNESQVLTGAVIDIYNALAQMTHSISNLQGLGIKCLPVCSQRSWKWSELRDSLASYIGIYETSLDPTQLYANIHKPKKSSHSMLVNPKASVLEQCLQTHLETPQAQENGVQKSAIVFAEQRVTCIALSRIFQNCQKGDLKYLRCTALVGADDTVSGLGNTPPVQKTTLDKFRIGDLNLLVATAVAEEGLDISHCSLVVRYTLPPTARQYIQSRGRARAPESHLILMVEHGNATHKALIKDCTRMEEEMLAAAKLRKNFSPDRVIEADRKNSKKDGSALELELHEYVVRKTGAKATINNSKTLIHQFCQKLPLDRYTKPLQPRYATSPTSNFGFESTVYLPPNCIVQRAKGYKMMSADMAQSSACLEAIRALHQEGALDDHLKPAFMNLLEDSNRTNKMAFHERVELRQDWPEILQTKSENVLRYLYRLVITNETLGSQDNSIFAQEFGMLVPNQILDLELLESSKVILPDPHTKHEKRNCVIRLELVGEMDPMSPELQELICFYDKHLTSRTPGRYAVPDSRRWPCSITDREVSPEANESSTVHEELGSPETGSCNAVGYQTPVDDKLRELLNAYKQESENLWGDADSSDHHTVHAISSNIEDSMIQRLEESHIEEEIFHDKDSMDAKAEDELSAVLSERYDDSASDQLSLHLPKAGKVLMPLVRQSGQWIIDWESIMKAKEDVVISEQHSEDIYKGRLLVQRYKKESNLFKVLRKREDLKFKHVMPQKPGANKEDRSFQQYLEKQYGVSNVDPNQCMLEVKEVWAGETRESQFLAPQLAAFHPLSQKAHQLTRAIRPILYHLLTIFNAQNAHSKFVAPEENRGKHLPSQASILEALMPASCQQDVSLERLEIIGDAALKLQATTHCYKRYPNFHEGQLEAVKTSMVCNSNLANVAVSEMSLHTCIMSHHLLYNWTVGHQLPRREVRSKAVADVCEALIGAFAEASQDQSKVTDFLTRITVLPKQEPCERGNQLSSSLCLEQADSGNWADSQKIEQCLGYGFRDKNLLMEACTHASSDQATCYQRLEFLGDAVIDFYVTKYLATTYREITPGLVTLTRSAAVNNVRLACVAVAHGFHHMLIHNSDHLREDIQAFVDAFSRTLQKHRTDMDAHSSEVASGKGATLSKAYDELTDMSYGLDLPDSPKVLADMLEAIVGAVYVDCGFQIQPVFKVAEKLLSPLPNPLTVPINPMITLLELLQKRQSKIKFMVRTAGKGFDVDCCMDGKIVSKVANCTNKKAGKVQACRIALQHLQSF